MTWFKMSELPTNNPLAYIFLILGDAINFLLTGSYSAAAASEADQSYFEAQAKGQVRKE